MGGSSATRFADHHWPPQVEEVMGVLASSLDEATEAGCRVTVVVFTGVFDMESV